MFILLQMSTSILLTNILTKSKSMHTAGHIYETVFNFAKYDWEDGPVLMYVLRDGEVPKGWTVTKFDLYDE